MESHPKCRRPPIVPSQKFLAHFSHRRLYVPNIVDLMAENMKHSEDFIEYALRWRAMAARSDVRLTEAQEIHILINNATGPIY